MKIVPTLLALIVGQLEMAPQYEHEKVGKISEQKGLNRLQMVQFEQPWPWHWFIT